MACGWWLVGCACAWLFLCAMGCCVVALWLVCCWYMFLLLYVGVWRGLRVYLVGCRGVWPWLCVGGCCAWWL